MKILGIDPGIGKCGVAVVEHSRQKSKLVFADCIETDKKLPMEKRLQELKEGLDELIKKYQPQEAAVEELFFAKNVKTALMVAQARGAILLESAEKNLPVFEYQPLEVKMALTGYGRATKKQVQEMVKLTLGGETIVQDDTADAVAVAICHLQHAKTRESIAKSSRENTLNIAKKSFEKESSENELVYPELSYEIVGALFDAFKELGPGLPEKYYYRAVKENLKEKKLPFKEQLKVEIKGLPVKLGRLFIDFVVDDKVVVEIKTGSRFRREDFNQIMNYLRQTGLRLGILARFGQNGVETRRLLLGRNF